MQLLVFERFHIIEEFVTRPLATSNYVAIFWNILISISLLEYCQILCSSCWYAESLGKVNEYQKMTAGDLFFQKSPMCYGTTCMNWIRDSIYAIQKHSLKRYKSAFGVVWSNQLEWNTIRPLLQQLFYCQSVYTSPFKLVLLKIFRKC